MNNNTESKFNNFFNTTEEFQAFNLEWKRKANAKNLTSADMALRAFLLNKDIFKSFKPKTKPIALANGYAPYMELDRALYSASYTRGWEKIITNPELQNYLKLKVQETKTALRNK